MAHLVCSNPPCKKGMAVYLIGESRFCKECMEAIRKASGSNLAKLDHNARKVFPVKDSRIDVEAYFYEVMDVTGVRYATLIHRLSVDASVIRTYALSSGSIAAASRSYISLTAGAGLALSEALDKCREWIEEVSDIVDISEHSSGRKRSHFVFNHSTKGDVS